ncbi:hypothetical protein NP233_g6378 [Leucocoprinus birnbaumii]|uniref:Uncharacterized protein n=1 Tax=Leucocoprinus birnbaumii TaxID=56174 RepID=A0AAD5VR37_9AGAR|nr:hypothetical protein NP233_g6378 [Leucocoprinus birnbaumii]
MSRVLSAPVPSSSADISLVPQSCVSLASSLRCYYSGLPTEINHITLIIPVALEVIFSTALLFTNWRSGRRYLLLVAEGWVIFFLSFLEVLAFVVPAVRGHISPFRAVDQSIGALSFVQLFFYMSFLFAWVQGECLPIVPRRIRQVARLLLLILIPAVITMNTIASFVGVSYKMGNNHVNVFFSDDRARFVWPFFSSITLALVTLFQATCFCFAFYRLIRAFLVQRQIEVDSKDAAVLFKGIAWINIGIKVDSLHQESAEDVFKSISVYRCCQGDVATEDFKAFRDELESRKSDQINFRRSKIRELISNPRFSTFRQLSPTATAFHATPRAPAVDYSKIQPFSEKPHPYAVAAALPVGNRNSTHPRYPMDEEKMEVRTPVSIKSFSASPKPTLVAGLPGMEEFAEIRTKRMSQRRPQRVTVYYDHGTPKLQLRLSNIELPTPAVVARSIKSRPGSQEYQNWVNRTPASQFKGRSRFSVTSRESSMYDEASIYPISTAHGHTVESEAVHRHGTDPYGYFTPSPSMAARTAEGSPQAFAQHLTPPTTAAHGHSQPSTPSSMKFDPPTPNFLNPVMRRFSEYSDASDVSAAQAEIVDTPRRKLSVTKQRSALARAVLYPVPGTKVAMTLAGESPPASSSSARSPRRLHKPRPNNSQSSSISLPTSQRPSPSPSPAPPLEPQYALPTPLSALRPNQQQQPRTSFIRQSVVDEDGNVITVTAIAPSIDEEEYDSDGKPTKRSTRALSGYSVGSVPETLQTIRELANKFPGLPPGAVVADIGFRASAMTPVKERDEVSTISGHSHSHDETSASLGHGKTRTVESTDTEEMIKKRIPAEMKLKGKIDSDAPVIPLPPIPGQHVQQLPPMLPTRSALRPRRPLPTPQPTQTPSESQPQPQVPFAGNSIDPFDDDTTSYPNTASELSPLSMSVKLRHPQSFISTMYPSTRRNSGVTTGFTSPVTPTYQTYFQNSSNNATSSLGHAQTGESVSPGIIDFGTALKEWNVAGQKIPGVRPMSNLPTIEMIEGHRRSLSAQTRAEFDRQQGRRQQIDSIASYDSDVVDELPDQLHQLHQQQQSNGSSGGAGDIPLNRIKSIGKAPRRVTPQPTRSHHVRGSTHLQPLIIPSSFSGRDVPISAVGAGGAQTILGVNRAGLNVDVGQEQEDAEGVLSATTEGATSSNGRGIVRYSEALSIEDGGYFPIRLQRKESAF